ncbi:MAG: ABC transporter permease [Dehalococcoidia bacterium]
MSAASFDDARETMARRRRRALGFKTIRLMVFYFGLLGIWQLVAIAEYWPSYVFPGPEDVYRALKFNIDNGDLWHGMQSTMTRMLIGYSASIVIGLGIGVVMGMFDWVDETVGSLVLGLQSLPSVTWFPLAILWFGLNERAIIFVVLMGSVCSIAISSRSGVRSIPPLLMRASRMFGGRTWQRVLYVIVPGMLPSMIQGLKLGWSFAWRSLLAAELLFVSLSLGHLLSIGRDLNDVAQVVAIMLVIVAIGMAVDRVLFGQADRWVRERWGLG